MKKRFSGLISLIMALIMILSIMPAALVSAERIFKTETIAEIEDAFSVRNALTYEQSKYASGGVYAEISGSSVSSADKITVSDFDFNFDIEKKGTYCVYVRVMFPQPDTDKFYVAWDFENWETCELGATASEFKWILADERKLTAGTHKLSLAHGETEGCFDAVYVCPRGTYPPDKIEGVSAGKVVSGYTLVHKQEEIPVIMDAYLFEAEKATIYSPFAIKSGKGASGSVVTPTKAKSPNRDVLPVEGTPGKLEFKFIAGKTATYSLWVRKRTPVDSSKNIYFSFNGAPYVKTGLQYSEDWEWYNFTAKSANEGQECTISFYERFKDMEIDSLLITTGGFTPSGKEGTPIAGSEEIPTELDQNQYAVPEITPPAYEHPRVLFTKKDIPKILENLDAPQNATPVARYKEYLESDYDGTPNGREYHQLPTLEAKAFDFAVNGNVENGRKAVEGIIKYLNGYNINDSSEETRDAGNIVFIASEIYDWCYEITNLKEKNAIMDGCINLISEMETEWPIRTDMGVITGHLNEAMFLKDILAFAIATYDERPDIWNNIGGRFYQEFVPTRKYFNTAGYHHQGASYGMYRHRWDTWAYLLIVGMGAPEPFDGEDVAEMAYQLIYQRRPDGQYFRNGDNHHDSREKMWGYWGEYEEVMGLDQAVIDDPYIKNELFRLNPFLEKFDDDYSENSSPITYLIYNNPTTEAKSYDGLPQSRYFGSPVGLTIARTGWNDGVESPDAIAWMHIGERRTNNHQHANCGAFQFYYKGILASRSGIYQGYTTKGSSNGSTQYSSEHVWMYASKSIAYNTMLIYDPSEPGKQAERGNVSDGGQREIFGNGEIKQLDEFLTPDSEEHDTETGKVVGQEIDPKNPLKPAYTYLKGDLTKAYISRKCENYDRSFMFLNLFNDEVPAALIVYDRVTSTNPDFKKTWLLHTQEQPVIEGSKIVAQRTLSSSTYDMGYNGKLTVDSLLPKASTIKVVGSEEEGWHNINGIDWTGLPAANKTTEGISYRVEISPEKAAKSDHFLNVLQAADAGTDNYLPVDQFETDKVYGLQISDRVVTFAKETANLSEVSFETKGEGTLKYTVCDVVPGTWEVTVGEEVQTIYVTEEGKLLAFDAPSGKVSAKKVSDETIVHPDANDQRAETERKASVRIDNFFVYSKEDPKVVDGTLMIPISLLEQYYALRKKADGGTTIYSNQFASVYISPENDLQSSYILKGEEKKPIKIYYQNGEAMVPARALVEVYGGTITWADLAKTAFITTPPKDYSKPEGYADIKSTRKDFSSIDTVNDNIIELMLDEDVNTHWGAKGVGRHADFELAKESYIESVEIVFNPNSARNAAFEIHTSLDGKTWKTVFVGAGDGSVEAGSWEKFAFEVPELTRWIRYVANGSNKSDWNGVKEIRFKEAQ